MTKVTNLPLDDRSESGRRRIHLREISGDADAPLETVGRDLRAARLRRGDEVAAVSRVLRIRKDHIEAIEGDRLEALPGRTYAVGFVRSYADYLGLDPVQCVERFKEEITGRSDGAPHVGVAPDPGGGRLPLGWTIAAVAVLALVAYGGYYFASGADRTLSQPVAPVPARMAPVTGQRESQELGGGGRQSSRVVSLGAAGALPQPGGHTEVSARANSGTSSPGATVAQGTVPAAEPLSQGEVFGQQNRKARVVLSIRGVTRVVVQGPNGRVYINRILHPGDSYRVPNLVGLLLTTADAGAISVELDGQTMGTAGPPGQISEGLPLDPQALADRFNRSNPTEPKRVTP